MAVPIAVAATPLALGPPPAQAAGPTFNGACALITLAVTYSPPLERVPGLGTTEVDLEGSAVCLVDQVGSVYETTTVSGSGSTPAGVGTFVCAGGVATGSGDVDVPGYVGFPHGQAHGSMVIAMVAGVGHISLVSTSGSVVGAGVFVQDVADTQSCLCGTPLGTTSWTGSFAFTVTNLVLD